MAQITIGHSYRNIVIGMTKEKENEMEKEEKGGGDTDKREIL
jgi:hypothetical protein